MTDRDTQLKIGSEAMDGLLSEFRMGNTGQPAVEKAKLGQHLGVLSKRWDERFPGLPEEPFPYSSAKGISRRGRRDAYLKEIIVKLLGNRDSGTIVNPVCVWGRHSRDLARRLPHHEVLGTDIQGGWNRWYARIPWKRTPANHQFRLDDIFEPQAQDSPLAVVFFGACASLSDAAMDFAIGSHCPLLVCRTCCHTVIGGNLDIVKRPDFTNRSTRFAMFLMAKKLTQLRDEPDGRYFSPKYSADHYPQSETARSLTDSSELMAVASHTVNSDICRSIIDLDRTLHLAEAGYDVWYRAEMFVAELATTPDRVYNGVR